MVGEEGLIGVIGFVLVFFSCMLLWFWIEQRNARKENVNKN